LEGKKIVVFASGSGSNFSKICEHFHDINDVSISRVVCNNVGAGVIEKASFWNVDVTIINKLALNDGSLLSKLVKIDPDLIVLAGFLFKVPEDMIEKFEKKIINIHPSLLPKYGGKGMYGFNVHKNVIKNSEPYSGITIHYVNKNYDEGNIIFQKKIKVNKNETANNLAKKILKIEHKYYPKVIHELLCDE
tara:strand:+ start:1630 stop:2202 length:573 start_codon:yes stop_codon:yes gene_type:complete